MRPMNRSITRGARGGAWATALSGAAAMIGALGIGRFLLTPLLPLMLQQSHLGNAAAGWLAGATNLGYLAGALSCARLPLRAHQAVGLGLLLVAVCTALQGLDAGLTADIAARAAVGVGSAWAMVHAVTAVPRRLRLLGRSELEGLLYAPVGLVIAATGVGVPWLAARGASVSTLWLAFAAFGVLSVPLGWRFLRSSEPAAPRGPATAVPKGAWWLVGLYGLSGFGYAIPATFLPLVAREMLHQPDLADRIWPWYGLVAAAVSLVLPLLRVPNGNRAALTVCMALMGTGTAACLLAPSVAGLTICSVLNGAVLFAIVMFTVREAQRLAPGGATTLVAWLTSAFGLGQILGPLSAGYAAEIGGSLRDGLMLTEGAVALSIAFALAGARRKREPALSRA
jgi:MFS family permease